MTSSAVAPKRLKLALRGAVQGVGFRPFVYRLARELGLNGWVNNSVQGVFLEVEGPPAELERFLLRLEAEKPPRSFIQSLEASWLDPADYADFEIRQSQRGGIKTALVLPDIATCPDCVREIFDPANRRYGYPFTNCTNCGPRFSIIRSLPYDRANTSMAQFPMCALCQREYDDPRDRRFHAQPNACPKCGPRLELWDRQGTSRPGAADPLLAAAAAIRAGRILAFKGLGGFHLLVAAHDDEAVRRLRERKHREEKPFALMFPSFAAVQAVCEVSPLEERLLRSPEAPVVLLRRAHAPRAAAPALAPSLAPGNPNLGVMLPYTPLHHLLLARLAFPVVATSGNLSDEPICTDEREALARLGGLADLFLVHNRPIVRHVDDSVARVMLGRELVLRRARGYAPLPVQMRSAQCGVRSEENPGMRSAECGGKSGEKAGTRSAECRVRSEENAGRPVLAVGGHLKNTVALGVGGQAFLSQHIGDLETDAAYQAFRQVIVDFEKLYDAQPALIVADLHPDYLSTKFARELKLPCLGVQHHLAHVLACMAENELSPPVLGVSWDGTGYGVDGTIWGGEFFLITAAAAERVAHFRPFRLPGGDRAVKEPRRAALGLLFELFGPAAFAKSGLAPLDACSPAERATLKTMLERRVNSPLTSSAGRLFDAVASLAGLRQIIRYEGQAAMELEFALEGTHLDESYPISTVNPPAPQAAHPPLISNRPPLSADCQPPLVLDWSPLVEAVLEDVKRALPIGVISAKFHNALAEAIVALAKRFGQQRLVLSGGCFQNRYLTERAVRRLQTEGFRPYWHQRVPPNDGGLALGQLVAAFFAG